MKAQVSLHMKAVSPEPLLFAHSINWIRSSYRQRAISLAQLSGCAWAFEASVATQHADSFSQLSHLMTKPTKRYLHSLNTQISLGIHPVRSETSLCTQWVAKDPSFLRADSEDSDQTGRMPRLIWVFAGRTGKFVGFVTRPLNFFVILFTEAWVEQKEIQKGRKWY